MQAPGIAISFIEKAVTAVKRGSRGAVMLILKEAEVTAPFTVYGVSDIPAGLSEASQEQIRLALKGYILAPQKVFVYVMDEAEPDYPAMMQYCEKQKFDFLAIPSVEDDQKTEDVAAWVKALRTAGKRKKTFKAVLPNIDADQEGVINVTGSLYKDDKAYPAAKICARIAGLLAGTPLNISATYAPLPDFTGCEMPDDLDAAVDAGELVFLWDGEKVKVCRAVTSLTTTTGDMGESFQKIKLVQSMDLIYDDIMITAQDSYIGKYANSYANKCLLIAAIGSYFDGLVRDNIISAGSCEIDLGAQRQYLKGTGKEVVLENGTRKKLEACTDEEIRKANTGSHVFLKATVSLLDAIEDIVLPIYI